MTQATGVFISWICGSMFLAFLALLVSQFLTRLTVLLDQWIFGAQQADLD